MTLEETTHIVDESVAGVKDFLGRRFQSCTLRQSVLVLLIIDTVKADRGTVHRAYKPTLGRLSL